MRMCYAHGQPDLSWHGGTQTSTGRSLAGGSGYTTIAGIASAVRPGTTGSRANDRLEASAPVEMFHVEPEKRPGPLRGRQGRSKARRRTGFRIPGRLLPPAIDSLTAAAPTRVAT